MSNEYDPDIHTHSPEAHGVICVDYDGTLFPWGPLMDWEAKPLTGAVEAVQTLSDAGYRIVIFTSRLSEQWLKSSGNSKVEQFGYVFYMCNIHSIPFSDIMAEKIPAQAYLDDKGIHFDGNWSRAVASLGASLSKISQTDLAWAAGIIEGEGNIDCGHRGNSVTVQASMTDKDVIDRLHDIFLGKGGRWEDSRAGRKTMYGWRVQSREDARFVIELILPWLGIRRLERAKYALTLLDLNRGHSGTRKYCPQGHEYNSDNIIKTSDNKRQCKACMRDRSRRWYEQDKDNINKKRRERYAKRSLVNA